jgi:hypothetical protein
MKGLQYSLATLLMLCVIATARAQNVVPSEGNSRFIGFRVLASGAGGPWSRQES